MINAFIKFGDGRISRETDNQTLTAALHDSRATFWIDMNKATDEELSILDDVFGFHPLAIEDTIQYNQRPKIESYNHVGEGCVEGYFYMVVHGPDLASFREKMRTKELDMFVSARYLLTIHDEPMKSIEDVLVRAQSDPRVVLDPGIDMLLHNILDHLVDHYTPILDHLGDEIDELEDKAVTEPTPDLLQKVALKKRDLLTLRRIIGPQREVLAQLTRGEVPFIRETTRVYLRDVQDHLIRAVETIELYRDLVLGARDIYLSSISNHLNQIMKTLTIISVVALPLTIVTSFFGMNFDAISGLHSPIGFWGAIAFMGMVEVVLLYLFRVKKWI